LHILSKVTHLVLQGSTLYLKEGPEYMRVHNMKGWEDVKGREKSGLGDIIRLRTADLMISPNRIQIYDLMA